MRSNVKQVANLRLIVNRPGAGPDGALAASVKGRHQPKAVIPIANRQPVNNLPHGRRRI